MSELSRLKKRAKDLYLKAQNFDDLSCGRHMAEVLRPSIGVARVELREVWARIKELDPNAPDNPLEG